MSTRAKWMWTIVIVLVVAVLGVGAFMAGQWFGHGGRMGGFDRFDREERSFTNPMMPYDRFSYGFHSPLGWLGMGALLLRCALPLGILALAVVGAVSLLRRPGASKSVAAVPAVESTAAPATTVLRECAGCGKPAQAEWKVCPYCGTALE